MRVLSSATNLIEASIDASTGTIIPMLEASSTAARCLQLTTAQLELDILNEADIKAARRELTKEKALHDIAKQRLALSIDMEKFKAEALSLTPTK